MTAIYSDARLRSLPGDLAKRIQPLLDDPLHVIPRAIQCHFGEPPAVYNGLVHRPPEGGLVIELERSGVTIDHSKHVAKSLQCVVACGSMQMLCDETARMFEALTGYDRVMVYRFDDDGHGEVFAEQRKPELEPFLGMRYPRAPNRTAAAKPPKPLPITTACGWRGVR